MKDRLFVAGANGYIGGNLVRSLASGGYSVEALTRARVATGLKMPAPGEAGAAWLHAAGLSVRGKTFEEEAAKALDHAFASATAANRLGVRRFILFSSIYASLEQAGDRSTYGAHKLAVECAIRSEFAGELVVLRLPPVYGAETHSSISRLARLITRGVPLPLGCATEPRDYLAIANLCALAKAIVDRPFGTDRSTEMHEPSDGEPIATRQLAMMIGSIVGRPPKLLSMPRNLMEVAAAALGKKLLVQGAFDKLTTAPNATLLNSYGWTPAAAIPETLDYLRRA